MTEVIRHSIFDSNAKGHGGEKRTAQITFILENANIKYTYLPSLKKSPFSIRLLRLFVKSLIITFKQFHQSKNQYSLQTILKFSYHMALLMSETLGKKEYSNKYFLWESTKPQNCYIPLVMKLNHCKIVALPHNIESLVPQNISFISKKVSPSWFIEEIEWLKICDVVYAISKEDTLLLKQFNLNAHYLPYYPEDSIQRLLLEIKERRISKQDKDYRKILMLGSAINPPTKTGMLDRIHWFQNHNIDKIELIVAGFGTEELIEYESTNIIVKGSLSNSQLEELLCEVDAVLIHQNATSGALTRIIELLISGIPVIANFESARNYFQTGIEVYNTDKEFELILKRHSFNSTFKIESHIQFYDNFVSIVSNDISQHV